MDNETKAALYGAIVGGFIAGFFSVFATWLLLRSERKLRQEETKEKVKIILSSLYHELTNVWGLYMAGIGAKLDVLEDEKPFPYTVPMEENYYVIYDGNAHNIGLIPNPRLRDKIITTSTLAKALKDSFLLNNKLNDETVDAQDRMKSDMRSVPLASIFQDKEKKLIENAPHLKSAHDKTKKEAEELIQALKPFSAN
jgi:hypothetical protein